MGKNRSIRISSRGTDSKGFFIFFSLSHPETVINKLETKDVGRIKFAGSLVNRLVSPGDVTTLAENGSRLKRSEVVFVRACR